MFPVCRELEKRLGTVSKEKGALRSTLHWYFASWGCDYCFSLPILHSCFFTPTTGDLSSMYILELVVNFHRLSTGIWMWGERTYWQYWFFQSMNIVHPSIWVFAFLLKIFYGILCKSSAHLLLDLFLFDFAIINTI